MSFCPMKAVGLVPLDEWRTFQQVELVDKPYRVIEYRARWYRDSRTGKEILAPLPEEVQSLGLLGARLSALVAYQKSACHMSYTTIQRFLQDVFGLSISRGQLAKVIQKVSVVLRDPYDELCGELVNQSRVGVDESGHPECGAHLWTWCFRADKFTVFHIDPSRGSKVLKSILTETFGGVVGSDYFSAYRKYMADCGAPVQFCMAHLIRDIRFLAEHADRRLSRWGHKLLKWIKKLFATWHRAGQLTKVGFARSTNRIRREFLRAVRRPPDHPKTRALAKRFRGAKADDYFRFLTTPGVEPTNNLTEQAIRHIVIDRRITQGTRGERGRRWCERAWTLMATCRQQTRSVFEFLHATIVAHAQNRPAPSLLPQTP